MQAFQIQSPFESEKYLVWGIAIRFVPVIAVACGSFTGGVALSDGDPKKAFLLMFGFALFVCFFAGAIIELWGKLQIHDHAMNVRQVASQAAPPSVFKTQWVQSSTSGNEVVMAEAAWQADERPPKELLQEICQYAFTHQMRVPEKELRTRLEHPERIEIYLACMERMRILKRVGDYSKAPRVWREGVSLMNAWAAFGYADETWLPKAKDGNHDDPLLADS